MGDQVDGDTGLAIDLWLRESLHGVSSRLLGVEDAGVTEMMLMCNPVRDHGPARWHRDFSPSYCAPLEGYVRDILENGPRYVQWNIPLHDDNVLWVVPGSHVRRNSDEENAQLRENDAAPLSTGVRTELNAGDGVAYILPILHWGSNYSTKRRRTVHGGFSMFSINSDLRFLDHVAATTRMAFERWRERSTATMVRTAEVLRAALDKDAAEYHAALDRLHPGKGPEGKLQSTIFLSKAAGRIKDLKDPDFGSLTPRQQSSATSLHPMMLQWGTPIADRFTAAEAVELLSRYQPMDKGPPHGQGTVGTRISGTTEHLSPEFHSGRGQSGAIFRGLVGIYGASMRSTRWAVLMTSRRSVSGVLLSRMQSIKCPCMATCPS